MHGDEVPARRDSDGDLGAAAAAATAAAAASAVRQGPRVTIATLGSADSMRQERDDGAGPAAFQAPAAGSLDGGLVAADSDADFKAPGGLRLPASGSGSGAGMVAGKRPQQSLDVPAPFDASPRPSDASDQPLSMRKVSRLPWACTTRLLRPGSTCWWSECLPVHSRAQEDDAQSQMSDKRSQVSGTSSLASTTTIARSLRSRIADSRYTRHRALVRAKSMRLSSPPPLAQRVRRLQHRHAAQDHLRQLHSGDGSHRGHLGAGHLARHEGARPHGKYRGATMDRMMTCGLPAD